MRRYDLDWLRVIAVLLLVPFHSLLVFDLDPNSIVYVKDSISSDVFVRIARFIHQFHMPLLFVISGSASYYALEKRNGTTYLSERFKRLFIPLLFGILFIIPPMTYLTRLSRNENINFINHYQGFFNLDLNDLGGLNGLLTPAHLWFILYLFCFSIISLPLFLYLKKHFKHIKLFTHRFALLLLFLPIVIFASLDILGDKNPFVYFIFFIYGYFLASHKTYQESINRDLPYLFILVFIIEVYRQLATFNLTEWTPLWMFNESLFIFNRWALVLVFLGLGSRYLNFNNQHLSYLSKAAFPIYILHLPINTLIVFFTIKLNLNYGIKFLIIVLLTYLFTFIVYEILKRIKITRFLFGLK